MTKSAAQERHMLKELEQSKKVKKYDRFCVCHPFLDYKHLTK